MTQNRLTLKYKSKVEMCIRDRHYVAQQPIAKGKPGQSDPATVIRCKMCIRDRACASAIMGAAAGSVLR